MAEKLPFLSFELLVIVKQGYSRRTYFYSAGFTQCFHFLDDFDLYLMGGAQFLDWLYHMRFRITGHIHSSTTRASRRWPA
jgi:polysaccharide pyruvyl transferase WcaK-like protein